MQRLITSPATARPSPSGKIQMWQLRKMRHLLAKKVVLETMKKTNMVICDDIKEQKDEVGDIWDDFRKLVKDTPRHNPEQREWRQLLKSIRKSLAWLHNLTSKMTNEFLDNELNVIDNELAGMHLNDKKLGPQQRMDYIEKKLQTLINDYFFY